MAKILHAPLEALGAKILFWSRSRKNAELNDLMAAADIVSLHLPLTPDTRHCIDPRRMKRGAILVNTARGALVNDDLLYDALKNGHLAAAGLDVFSSEPPPAGNPLLSLSNIVCAPHAAWLSTETLERSIAAALQNVGRLRDGLSLSNRVA